MTFPPPPLLDVPPDSDQLTDYDRTHLTTYLFLLDWSAGGGDWRKATERLFGEEIAADPFRAKNSPCKSTLDDPHWLPVAPRQLTLEHVPAARSREGFSSHSCSRNLVAFG